MPVRRFDLRIDRLASVLWLCTAVVWGLGVLRLALVKFFGFARDAGPLQELNLDAEGVLGAWYSSGLLLVAALALALAGILEAGQRWMRASWFCLAAVMAVLSFDESASLHEHAGQIVSWLDLPTRGVPWTWVMVGAFVVAVVGLLSLPMLLRMDRRTARGFCLAGAVYVGGVLGVEFVASHLIAHESWRAFYNTASTIEEGLEMAGLTLFLVAVLRHLARSHPIAEARLVLAGRPAQAEPAAPFLAGGRRAP